MKTTDLIPLILHQLVDGDKYGYEIVKQIEDASNGSISIKQPTLYSVLKKLEQGKFISSYWQDSEIGGKRHYYKLTDNGRSQIETYPSFEQLIKECGGAYSTMAAPLSSTADNSTVSHAEEPAKIEPIEEEAVSPIVKIDNDIVAESSNDIAREPIIDDETIKPMHIDLTQPAQPISVSVDNVVAVEMEPKTEFELKQSDNTTVAAPSSINIFDAIQPSNEVKLEAESSASSAESNFDNIFSAIDFAKPSIDNKVDNKVVVEAESEVEPPKPVAVEPSKPSAPIIENRTVDNNKLYNKLSPSQAIADEKPINSQEDNISPAPMEDQVQYLNYVDLSTDKASLMRKKALKMHILKMALTCVSLAIVLAITMAICANYTFGKLYYIYASISVFVVVLYPLILLRNITAIRIQYCSTPFKYSFSRTLLIAICLFLSSVLITFAYNLTIVDSVIDIFRMNNFANFLAPILLGSVIMLDCLFAHLCYRQFARK